ncbi:zinc finger Y-chromosomal protein-like isoform X1 [Nasonia vitripennis]|uniref:C2H2-type domain-containing protein n=2 Tax=Nasonia vitripennis TaxID=7425 RepID=A0A7M7GCJ1_NASVI|nr:zinc finger Y-chromosomal protein-like isoform X1 [Nasonia vitripennis]
MDYLFVTDFKPTTEPNSLWQIDKHVDLAGYKKEEDDIDDDFVLKFSTDESDCEDDATHSSDNNYNSPPVSEYLAKNCNDSSSMQNKTRSMTYTLRDDDKITNTTRGATRRNVKSKVMKNQKSVLDYFRQRYTPDDDQVADEIKKDPNPDVRLATQKLIRQLLSARVILERLPDSLTVKNGKPSDNDCQEYQGIQTKRYCAGCDRTFLKRGRCLVCNSVLKYECAKCGNRCSSYNKHRYHLELKCFNRALHQCPYCNYSSLMRSCLRKHIKSIHVKSNNGLKSKSYFCHYCDDEFSVWWEYLRHKQVCNQTDPKVADDSRKRKLSSCDFSDVNACKKSRLDVAYPETLKRIKVICPKCAKTKVIQDSILHRICWDRRCRSALCYECTACGKQYHSPVGIKRHMESDCPSTDPPRNKIQCTKCAYVSSNMVKMYSHMRYSHPPDDQNVEFSCKICNKKFTTKNKLSSHLYYCKRILLYVYNCELCEFRTKYSASIKIHCKRIHSIVKYNVSNV